MTNKDKRDYLNIRKKAEYIVYRVFGELKFITSLIYRGIMFLMLFGLFVKDYYTNLDEYVINVLTLMFFSFNFIVWLVTFFGLFIIIVILSTLINQSRFVKERNYDKRLHKAVEIVKRIKKIK